MFQLLKKKIHSSSQWFYPLTQKQYDSFKKLIEAYYKKNKISITLHDDGYLSVGNDTGSNQKIGLQNLAQLCAQSHESKWKEIIEKHFFQLESFNAGEDTLKDEIKDFARVQSLLGIRLWPKEYLVQIQKGKPIYKNDITGVVSILVLDLPTSIRTISSEEANVWGLSEEKLWSIALENMKKRIKAFDISNQDIGDIQAMVIVSDDFLTSSVVYSLEDIPNAVGAFGSLVAIPNRHVVLVYPIQDDSVVRAVQKIIPIAHARFNAGPGSITPQIFWYQNKTFVELPAHVSAKGIQFTPPDEFVMLLNNLAS